VLHNLLGSSTIFALLNGGFAADKILWGEQFFFCAKAQKKNCSPPKNILSRQRRRNIFAKIVNEPFIFSNFLIRKKRNFENKNEK
jgi:hypothetical protein